MNEVLYFTIVACFVVVGFVAIGLGTVALRDGIELKDYAFAGIIFSICLVVSVMCFICAALVEKMPL